MEAKKRRFIKGDIFAINVVDDVYCYGQIIDKKEDIYAIYNLYTYSNCTTEVIVQKPILFLVQSFDVKLKQGAWSLIGNHTVPVGIVYPEFKVDTTNGYHVVNYKGEFLRTAREYDIKNLNYQETVSPALLEDAIKAKYGILEWDNEYYSMLYKNE